MPTWNIFFCRLGDLKWIIIQMLKKHLNSVFALSWLLSSASFIFFITPIYSITCLPNDLQFFLGSSPWINCMRSRQFFTLFLEPAFRLFLSLWPAFPTSIPCSALVDFYPVPPSSFLLPLFAVIRSCTKCDGCSRWIPGLFVKFMFSQPIINTGLIAR